MCERDRGIAVANIPFGALRITSRRRFAQRIAIGNRTILSNPTARTPATMRNTMFNGKVECSPVRSRLSARNDGDIAARQLWRRIPRRVLTVHTEASFNLALTISNSQRFARYATSSHPLLRNASSGNSPSPAIGRLSSSARIYRSNELPRHAKPPTNSPTSSRSPACPGYSRRPGNYPPAG